MPVSPGATVITRRNLPHWRRDGAVYWVTFRLADSLPQTKLAQLYAEKEAWFRLHPKPWTSAQLHDWDRRVRQQIEAWLDAGYGSQVLALPDVRATLINCLLRFEGERHALHAAVIMPNHVHALMQPLHGESLAPLLKGIKGASARTINRQLARQGALWMDESYDHIVRGETEFTHFTRYIRENPLKAKLGNDQYWLYP